ncbi:MAG: MerR family transcriptional regulator [Chitinophagales bacterium]|nr:MerR family transcriptional regulator [Chitinophagales bacterium]HAE13759.1 MerR family transcriptional regulator [Bacteroidota bacterium]MCB9019289.1 MerR family transcriptional regulator [Chitinophagales bacterium]MCB9020540.1 MerR family transcriptional regulator [Chitinophagales bacterium]MCB9031510.1 MerR family transcriptional regulator [Chitinophagales bacterium]
MPYKEKEIEKRYWTIGEVADELQVSASLLRFWESEIGIIQPKKNRKGDRFYSRKDIDTLRLIYHLVKEKGYTLKGARQQLLHSKDGEEAKFEAIESLKKIREFLVQIRDQL